MILATVLPELANPLQYIVKYNVGTAIVHLTFRFGFVDAPLFAGCPKKTTNSTNAMGTVEAGRPWNGLLLLAYPVSTNQKTVVWTSRNGSSAQKEKSELGSMYYTNPKCSNCWPNLNTARHRPICWHRTHVSFKITSLWTPYLLEFTWVCAFIPIFLPSSATFQNTFSLTPAFLLWLKHAAGVVCAVRDRFGTAGGLCLGSNGRPKEKSDAAKLERCV